MALPRGRTIRLTPLRRFITDLMWASRRVPLVAIERTMPLADVIAARGRATKRPSWFAIFMKAYAIVSDRRPELRCAYLTWPWERLYQHAGNIGALAVGRRVDEEDGVLAYLIEQPELLSLLELDTRIRAARTEPVEQFDDFRFQIGACRYWPRCIRRFGLWFLTSVSGRWRERYLGTFGLTGVGALGSASLSLLSPQTTTISYGVFEADGRVTVRMFYDHRVLDGVGPSRAMEELEAVLRGPIRDELLALPTDPGKHSEKV
jgi:hypothetical protein